MGIKLPKAFKQELLKKFGFARPRQKRSHPEREAGPKPVASPTPGATWVVVIPNYIPPTLNYLLGLHWSKRKAMKRECADFAGYFGKHVPKATGKRRVLLTYTRTGHKKEMDADNCKKIVLDALKKAGLIGDDSPEWCECPDPIQQRGEVNETTIVLEEC